MYVSIDRDKKLFLHKHHRVTTVCDLVFIEAHDRNVHITSLSAGRFLVDYTESELQAFYQHTTGDAEPSPFHGDELRRVLAELVSIALPTDCDAFEADIQAAFIDTQRKLGHIAPTWRYLKGQKRPKAVGDEAARHLCARLTAEQAEFAAKQRTAPAPVSALLLPAATGVAPAEPRAPRVKSSGSKDTIWKVADTMWEAEGKSRDKQAVLALRKKVMDTLEREHGVKRTTSSSELGNWQKARI